MGPSAHKSYLRYRSIFKATRFQVDEKINPQSGTLVPQKRQYSSPDNYRKYSSLKGWLRKGSSSLVSSLIKMPLFFLWCCWGIHMLRNTKSIILMISCLGNLLMTKDTTPANLLNEVAHCVIFIFTLWKTKAVWQVRFNVRYWLHCQSFLLELKSF